MEGGAVSPSAGRGRIAFVLSSLKFGGGERVVLNLASALQSKGYAIDILLMSCEGEFLAEAQARYNVLDLHCDRTWKLPLRLGSYLRRSRPSALISSFWKLNVCACLARCAYPKVKLAVWEHSPPSRSRNSPTWLYAISASTLYRAATAVVTVSSGVATDVLRITWGLRNRVRTIWNPIPAPRSGSRVVHSPGRKIVWVGRLQDPKNPGLMLDAFSMLPASDRYSLEFVGDGHLRGELEGRARALGLAEKVKFVGFQQDPYPFIAKADLLVLSSDREGFGNVLVEALHCGLRTVSTDCGPGVHDILAGKYGTIVPTNDSTGLAAAIRHELERDHDPEVQVRAASRFEPNVIADQFLRALALEH